jgi:hypothetical protein
MVNKNMKMALLFFPMQNNHKKISLFNEAVQLHAMKVLGSTGGTAPTHS